MVHAVQFVASMDARFAGRTALVALFAAALVACRSQGVPDLGAAPPASPSLRAAHLEVPGPALATLEADLPGATLPACPDGMVEVEGDYCPSLEQRCLRWRDAGPGTTSAPRRCEEYAPSGPCRAPTTHKRFCIDRYEYPNVRGDKPVVMKTWTQAAATCRSLGKRLCTGSEWTLACEGNERLPYPTGLGRSAETCNIDKTYRPVKEAALASRDPATRDAEVDRLWQGEPSGARAACVSPFGVADMTGNVDEWVVNESGHPFESGSKGGYWGPVRNRCRPMTTAHNETFAFYQIGFRCCGEALPEGG